MIAGVLDKLGPHKAFFFSSLAIFFNKLLLDYCKPLVNFQNLKKLLLDLFPVLSLPFMEKQVFGGPFSAMGAGCSLVKLCDLRKHIKDGTHLC